MLYTPPINTTNLSVPTSSVSKHWATLLSPSPSPSGQSQSTVSSTSSPSSAGPSKPPLNLPSQVLTNRIEYLPTSIAHSSAHGKPRVVPTWLVLDFADSRDETSTTTCFSCSPTHVPHYIRAQSRRSRRSTTTFSATFDHSDSQPSIALCFLSTRLPDQQQSQVA